MIGPLTVLLPLLSAPLTGLQAASQESAARPVYGSLPLRNLTPRPRAAGYLMGMIRTSLEARGARFVPGPDMERFLVEHRIRYTDSLSAADAAALAAETGAGYVLAGALLRYESGTVPRISLALRLLDAATGQRMQSILITLSGDDFKGVLDLGAISDVRELELEVLARVLEAFEADGSPRSGLPLGERRGSSLSRGVRSWFVSEGFDLAEVERIVVMPLVNRTRHLGAGRQFGEVLGHEWFNLGGVQVVESSELRAALIREKVRSIDSVDPATLARVGRRLGARYFAMGSVEAYSKDIIVDQWRFPEIEVTVRIVDSESGDLVAASSVRRRGDDYHTILGLGSVEERLRLAVRVAREIVASLGRMP